MNQDNVFKGLMVVVILGNDELTKELCNGLHEKSGMHIACMSRSNPHPESLNKEDEYGMAIFLKHAKKALDERNHTLVVTGFPKSKADARALLKQCPHLLVLSHELGSSIISHKLRHNTCGLPYEEFKQLLEREEMEQPLLKAILGQGKEVTAIHGMRDYRKQRHFLENMIDNFRKGVAIKLHTGMTMDKQYGLADKGSGGGTGKDKIGSEDKGTAPVGLVAAVA